MKKKSAIKHDPSVQQKRESQVDKLGDPLSEIEACIDFKALAARIDEVAPRPVSTQGGSPPFPTETMVRILVLKHLNHHSDEKMEYLLLEPYRYTHLVE